MGREAGGRSAALPPAAVSTRLRPATQALQDVQARVHNGAEQVCGHREPRGAAHAHRHVNRRAFIQVRPVTVALLQQMQAVQHARAAKRQEKREERRAEKAKQQAKTAASSAEKKKAHMKEVYKQQGQRMAKKQKT